MQTSRLLYGHMQRLGLSKFLMFSPQQLMRTVRRLTRRWLDCWASTKTYSVRFYSIFVSLEPLLGYSLKAHRHQRKVTRRHHVQSRADIQALLVEEGMLSTSGFLRSTKFRLHEMLRLSRLLETRKSHLKSLSMLLSGNLMMIPMMT